MSVPGENDDDNYEIDQLEEQTAAPEARRSFQIQAKLVEIGAKMGFRVWVPRSDLGRVRLTCWRTRPSGPSSTICH